jgi:hypothetical protein
VKGKVGFAAVACGLNYVLFSLAIDAFEGHEISPLGGTPESPFFHRANDPESLSKF